MQIKKEYLSIPYLLIYSRIILGLTIPFILLLPIPKAPIIATSLIFVGLLTDVFDGIIARQMGISSERIRVWDSNVDQFFWLAILSTIFYVRFTEIDTKLTQITIITMLEVLAYAISISKFKKVVATHSILAKLWTVSLLIWVIELILFRSNYTFSICFILGIISRIEILLIIKSLERWVTDVPSILVVGKINRGEKIRKNKWFNG